MNIILRKTIAEAIGLKVFEQFGLEVQPWDYHSSRRISLDRSARRLGDLEKLLTKHKNVHGVGVLLRDIATWRTALTGAGQARARKVEQFKDLLREYLRGYERHHVYEREQEDVWLAYYVNEVTYQSKVTHAHSTTPEHVVLELLSNAFGGRKSKFIRFFASDCRAMTPSEALARQNLFVETPDRRAQYEAELSRFSEYAEGVGRQFLATGQATDENMDGNPDQGSHWRNRTLFDMVRNGQPSRVVVDVFFEDPQRDKDEASVNRWFWALGRNDDDDDDDVDPEDLDEVLPEAEVPTHPFLAIFDLQKHLRLKVHVSQLIPYEFDRALSQKLILPTEMKELVRLLIEHKAGAFRDIVKGKSGGAVILLTGPPGVGKTLTAEVYAESEERALYSVQCSQLGTNAEELESELLKVFARARRWKAVTLLDEADVYVHERGNDLHQNAIVGVFLRVLEYQDSVLFLTSNRPQDVDDAIASRCVARLVYPIPSPAQQREIWKVLVAATQAKMAEQEILRVVEKNRGLSGRDVKNLLKLAMLSKGTAAITAEDIEFVKQFQPTLQGHTNEPSTE